MKGIALLLILLLSAGCQKADLHHGLQELEADEILNLLNQNGITANKVKEVEGQEVSWKVSAPSRDIARARQILITNNLPRKRELGLSGVYKEKGLIPTPDEQKARFLLALKGEIINSLEKIPGVVDADLVLNVPDEDEFSELRNLENRPTASVVIRSRGDLDLGEQVTEGKIQRFVANSVPKLNPNDVTVIITRTGGQPASSGSGSLLVPGVVSPPSGGGRGERVVEIAGVRLERGSVTRFKGYFIGILGLLVVVAASLLITIVRLNRLRARLQAGAPVDAVPVEGGRRPLLGGGEGGVEGTFDLGRRGTG